MRVAVRQRLEGHIQADLVSLSEAVGDGLGGAGDGGGHAFDHVWLCAVGHHRAGKTHDAERRIHYFGQPGGRRLAVRLRALCY